METLPALFITHGSPMFAVRPGRAGAALAALARTEPRPRAVLVMSPHWSTRSPRVSTRATQTAWHDFGGFPPELYALQYAPPGAPWLAERVIALLGQAGVQVEPDAQRALDHGAWVPLMHMYPQADLPVVQLSLQPSLPPAQQMRIGAALRALRNQGVLLIGSGSITHNLGELDWERDDAEPYVWVREFRDWIFEKLQARDVEALADYRRRAPHAVRAHPTDEHLLPLFFALGAAGDDRVARLTDEVTHASIAMDAYAFGAHALESATAASSIESAKHRTYEASDR